MTLTLPIDVRRIIPRWRDSRIAIATGELVFPRSNRSRSISVLGEFLEKKQQWQENHQIEFAAELVASALSQGLIYEVSDAAEFLLENEDKTTPTVFAIAEEVLIRAGKRESTSRLESIPEIIEVPKLYSRIHNIRLALNNYPRNALLWVDISHTYTILGQLQKSRDAMIKALFLEPNNRFVLRSASRLFIHLDEPDYAHRILIDRPITRQDPWLLAAEIATATVAGQTSNLIRQSRDILSRGNHQPYHTAELASALATLELSKGSSRNARKLFQTSLIRPTENSVAQSVWAKQWLNSLEIDEAIKITPRTYEAQTWSSFFTFDWKRLMKFAEVWLADELFSSRPAIFGSYAASVGLEDFRSAERFSRIGLRANPSDYTLINNLAFSLAKQDKLDEAFDLMENLSRPAPTTSSEIALEATEGLIHLRKGDIQQGKAKYLHAIELSRHNSLPKLQALASIYYAQEMLRVGGLELSSVIAFDDEAFRKAPDPDVNSLCQKFVQSSRK